MIKAVLFDLDDTLYDQYSYIKQGFAKTAKKIVADFNLKNSNPKVILNKLNALFTKGERKLIFNRVLKDLLPQKSVKFINDYVEKELLLYYRLVPRNLKLFADVMPLFYFLHRKDKKIGLVTQGHPVNQISKLFLLKIYDYFDAIEISGNYSPKDAKPSPFLFMKILNKMKLKATEVIYVGDNLDLDIGSIKAGISLYYLNKVQKRKEDIPIGVKTIYSLLEIKNIVMEKM